MGVVGLRGPGAGPRGAGALRVRGRPGVLRRPVEPRHHDRAVRAHGHVGERMARRGRGGRVDARGRAERAPGVGRARQEQLRGREAPPRDGHVDGVEHEQAAVRRDGEAGRGLRVVRDAAARDLDARAVGAGEHEPPRVARAHDGRGERGPVGRDGDGRHGERAGVLGDVGQAGRRRVRRRDAAGREPQRGGRQEQGAEHRSRGAGWGNRSAQPRPDADRERARQARRVLRLPERHLGRRRVPRARRVGQVGPHLDAAPRDARAQVENRVAGVAERVLGVHPVARDALHLGREAQAGTGRTTTSPLATSAGAFSIRLPS